MFAYFCFKPLLPSKGRCSISEARCSMAAPATGAAAMDEAEAGRASKSKTGGCRRVRRSW